MNVLLVDNKSAHLENLQLLIREKIRDVQIVIRDPRDMTDADVVSADIVVFSGGVGRSIIKNPHTFHRMVELVEMHQKPTIGICLGAEAIAVYYGSVIEEMSVRRVGNVRSYSQSSMMRVLPGIEDSFMAYEFHKWKIPIVHTPLESLATSKDGVEVFKHTSLPIWGLQFHPEVHRNDNSGHLLFDEIVNSFKIIS